MPNQATFSWTIATESCKNQARSAPYGHNKFRCCRAVRHTTNDYAHQTPSRVVVGVPNLNVSPAAQVVVPEFCIVTVAL